MNFDPTATGYVGIELDIGMLQNRLESAFGDEVRTSETSRQEFDSLPSQPYEPGSGAIRALFL
jgi:hypothetical protein